MNIIRKIAAAGDKAIGVFSAFLAIAVLAFSGYVLYDNFYQSEAAFSSVDLQKYKPTVKETKLGFKDILEINKDTVAWLTIYDTNIDYPVLQGKNDMEYINKDIYGKSSLTGSIYLRTADPADFSSVYSLFYGHHMDNGAMFGNIEKFADANYFYAHRDGLLMSPYGNYDIKAFACLHTDAYDKKIYFDEISAKKDFDGLLQYVKQNAVVYANDVSTEKIAAFSTCADIKTNGRTVVFASLTTHDPALDAVIEEKQVKHIAIGHFSSGKNWALLDVICVVMTILTLFPLTSTGDKYYQFIYARKKQKELADTDKKTAKDLGRFKIKIILGTITEVCLCIAAVVRCIQTQNFRTQLVISGKYTYIFVSLFAAALLADIIFFRYRGKRPNEEQKSLEETEPQGVSH